MLKFLLGLAALALVVNFVLWLRYSAHGKPGNARQYRLENVSPLPDAPLQGKTFFCLGSSVTAGMSSGGVSFTDYLAKREGCTVVRSAVSASTLADRGPHSYLKRLRRHPMTKQPIDAFLCQLSTNDTVFADFGKISDSFDPADFDPKTTVGGIETIIALAKEYWQCPIVFFTGTRYDSPRYHKLVNLLLELEEKWGITVIDLWHDRAMNKVTEEEYRLYMHDGVHPTKAGYLLWWTPALQKGLYRLFVK